MRQQRYVIQVTVLRSIRVTGHHW